jgi:hypothetical protein
LNVVATGGIMKRAKSGASGALNPESKEAQAHAELYYEEIRKRSSDISTIASNIVDSTGFTQKAIQEIKNHLFINEHILNGKMQRFAPEYQQAQAWQRLIDGDYKESDIVLLKHEYVELTQMRLHGYDYDAAHRIANMKYNWQELIRKR